MISSEVLSERFTDPSFFSQHPWLEYVFIASAFMSQVFTLANTTSPLVQLKTITNHYGASSLERNWFQASFSLSAGALILVSGRIGDVFGLKATALWGYGWATIWTILVGASYWVNSVEFYIVARALQGAGLAFVLPNLMGIVGRIYQPGTHRKNMVFALIGMGAPLGGACGVLFSGIITEETKYFCWTYFAAAIAMGIAMGLAWWSVPNVHLQRDSEKNVDWAGCAMSVIGLVLLDFCVNQAPLVGWKTPYVIALLIISVVVLALFAVYETRFPKFPLLPAALLKSPRLLLLVLAKSLAWGSYGVLFFHYFTFLEDFRHYNPLEMGASQAHALLFGCLAAIACGYAIRHVPIHFVLIFSMLCFVGACIMQAVTPVNQTYWALTFPTWILSTVSTDTSFPSGSIILSEHLPYEYQGMAGSLINTIVNYSNSFFLGLSTVVEVECQKRWPNDKLKSFRAALYFGIALAGTALILTIIFTALEWSEGKVVKLAPQPPKSPYIEDESEDGEKEVEKVRTAESLV